MIKNAHELQEFINSVRKKAFEDVATLINSNIVTKDDTGFIVMYEEDLIKLIQGLDTAKIKKQKEESEAELDNLS